MIPEGKLPAGALKLFTVSVQLERMIPEGKACSQEHAPEHRNSTYTPSMTLKGHGKIEQHFALERPEPGSHTSHNRRASRRTKGGGWTALPRKQGSCPSSLQLSNFKG